MSQAITLHRITIFETNVTQITVPFYANSRFFTMILISGDPVLIARRLAALICCLFLSSAVYAAQITGTVTNATTGKPAADDEVTLLTLKEGMQETSSGRTDAQGKFTLDVPDESAEHLIRVSHAGAFYYKSAPAGTATAQIDVYDVAEQVDKILEEGHVYQMQTANGQLEVSEKYIMRNESVPPRTRMGDYSVEIELPPGSQLEESMAAGPGAMPVTIVPVPLKRKNHYGLPYPLRPGETQFRISYKVPYSGSFEFTEKPQGSLAELGILLPKSMKLNALGFTQDNDEAGMSVFFMKNISAAQPITFSVSGEGVAPREAQEPPAPEPGQPASAPAESSSARWYLIGLLFGVLGGCMIVFFSKTKKRASVAARVSASRRSQTALGSAGDSIVDALKEELFQLENDRLAGKITPHDYETSKAGLEALMRRQMGKTD